MKLDPSTRCSIISSVIYFGIFRQINSQNRYNVKAISAIHFKAGKDFNNTVKIYFSFDAIDLRVKIMRHTVAHYRGYFFLYLGNMKDNPLGNWIHMNILGNDTEANEIIKTLFQFDETLQAQVVSAGHEWTEGPIIVPGTTNNQENDILFFSDVPNDVIWRGGASNTG